MPNRSSLAGSRRSFRAESQDVGWLAGVPFLPTARERGGRVVVLPAGLKGCERLILRSVGLDVYMVWCWVVLYVGSQNQNETNLYEEGETSCAFWGSLKGFQPGQSVDNGMG